MRLERVISGGQTGADRGALDAARVAGIATGGWVPKGFRAQDGSRPEFAELYGVQEHSSDRYPPRTALNVKESDATLRFATDWNSPGEVLTHTLCERYGKPHLEVRPGGQVTLVDVAEWLARHNVRVLNVAGNTERPSPASRRSCWTFCVSRFACWAKWTRLTLRVGLDRSPHAESEDYNRATWLPPARVRRQS